MKKCTVIVVLFAVICSQGCCSLFKGGSELVSIDSNPQGAKVKVGPYHGTTPYTVQIPRGKDYVITAEYNGKSEVVSLNRSIQGLYWVNILLWPGLIVDAATGKMYNYDPTEYSFDFTQNQ